MSTSLHDRRPFVLLLGLCAFAYFGFHAVRHRLPPGFVNDSFPSLLTPLAMFSIIELMPSIRFRSRSIKFAVLAATTLFAALWLEAIVPRFTPRAIDDIGDAAAMGLGFVLFVLYDLALGRRSAT